MSVDTTPDTDFAPMALSALPTEPLVSILMANRNYGSYIAEAIGSVLEQTYQNVELIICDDASTDNSVEVIQSYMRRDARIKLLEREAGAGQGAAFSDLFAMSGGEILCFLDSDDTYLKHKVECVVQHFRTHPTVGLLAHPIRMVDAAGDYLGSMPFRTRLEHGWIQGEVIRRGGRWGYMAGGATCLRRDVAERIFPAPEEVTGLFSDGYINVLGSLLTEVSSIPDALYNYRVHGQNAMQRQLRDERVSRFEIDGMRAQVGATNRRLCELGLPEQQLDLTHNLNYVQHVFLLALFEGQPRRQLIREHLALTGMLLTDNLYPVRERLVRAVIYSVAIPLPMGLRQWWLLASRSPGRFVRHLRTRLSRTDRPAARKNNIIVGTDSGSIGHQRAGVGETTGDHD